MAETTTRQSPLTVSPFDSLRAGADWLRIQQAYWTGVYKYSNEFVLPFWTALHAFVAVEADKLMRHQLQDSLSDYLELLQFNLQQAKEALDGSAGAMRDYHRRQWEEAFSATLPSLQAGSPAPIEAFLARQAEDASSHCRR